MNQEEQVAVIDPQTGRPTVVGASQLATAQAINARHPLAGYVKLAEAGLPVSKNDWTDTFVDGPFTFKIRTVSENIRLADEDYPNLMIRELGLRELAVDQYDYSSLANPDAAIDNAARLMVATESFRVGHPELSRRFDRMVKQRYLQVLLGMSDKPDEPQFWGGLVGWTLKGQGLDNTTFPFSPVNVALLELKTLLDIYERILGLSRGGLSDARFRRANGG